MPSHADRNGALAFGDVARVVHGLTSQLGRTEAALLLGALGGPAGTEVSVGKLAAFIEGDGTARDLETSRGSRACPSMRSEPRAAP